MKVRVFDLASSICYPLAMPDLSPQDFVAKWRQTAVKERSGYQEHFIDLCRLIGHPTPVEDDPTGTRFTFEAGAGKQKGGQGWADVYKRGFFAWEYKGRHANLDKAYQQLLQYREALENPPLLVVSDMERIVVHTNFTNTIKQQVALTLDDLLTPDGMRRLRDIFYTPDAFKTPQTPESVTQEAARQFAHLADLLRGRGADAHAAAHFLIRLLFCLFAEDIDLLPRASFSRLVHNFRTRPDQFGYALRQLFEAMSTGGVFGYDSIRHFDGGLFDDASALDLGHDGLATLDKISSLDWSSIEPSVFGTLFERSLDPSKRAQLGAHYTSRQDILLIVEPVLMAPLRREWADVQARARDLAGRRDGAAGAQRTRLNNDLSALVMGFADRLTAVKVLDPACGSGNFLYVALKQLLDLEKAVSTFAGEVGLNTFFPRVSPEQLFGIELNEYAQQLAQATVWIGYLQWLHDNGYGFPGDPILKPLDNIREMDAILAYDAAGRPVEPSWPAADVIIGNPPFLGGNKIRQGVGGEYVDKLFKLYEGRVPAFADLVCYWFEKARDQIASGQARRAGLLATQGIRGGANRRVLERIKETGDIFWAQSDRDWVLEGATVHVAMIGFDSGDETDVCLDGKSVDAINPDLTATTNVTQAKRMSDNVGICFMGASPKGPFDIDSELARDFIRASGNVNSRPNSDVVRPVVSGVDIVQRSRNRWTIDFGLMPIEEAAEYEAPFQHVLKHVYPIRSKNRRAAYAARWWQYAEARPGMRQALVGKSRFIATPEVAKHRIFVWISADVLANQQVLVFARSDDYFFGVLHSKLHELWARRMGTQLREAESGFRYTPTTTFETFPFPWPPGKEPPDARRVQAIAGAARELVEKRDAWLNPPGASEADLKKRTLTNLYNARPAWLDLAHKKLDDAVLDAYGWPRDLTDEDILARLLALNLQRAAAQGQAPLPMSHGDDEGEG
ncbi:MAG: type IIL restriction-modification enzyme MmeI [Anaerolineae bacterium]